MIKDFSKLTSLFLFFSALLSLATASCNESDPINIYLLPHTHDDVGWLKTADQYFYGSRNDIQLAGVQYIIDSVVTTLAKYPKMKFIYVEIAFFWRWWKNADNLKKGLARNLIESGKLEFINGGWSMHDEANPYYEDMIGNMAAGHDFLRRTFNVTPITGWHIDPFGHSNANAAFFAQMGFTGYMFSRIDYQDMITRLQQKALEFIWIPETSQKEENAIFTSINFAGYGWPNEPIEEWNFDLLRMEYVSDNPNLECYNIEAEASKLINYFKGNQKNFATSNMAQTCGTDFNYHGAHIPFKNLNKLINFINARLDLYPNVSIQSSTPSEYLKVVRTSNVTLPTKTDDFFPYADNNNSYWTGYFTSRTAIKCHVRNSGRYFQNVKRLVTQKLWTNTSQSLSQNVSKAIAALVQLDQTMGILQHHDAVAGTETQAVADDYQFLLYRDRMRVQNEVTRHILAEDAHSILGIYNEDFQLCDTNITARYCNATAGLLNGSNVLIAVYNSLNSGTKTIRVKVPTSNITLKDSHANEILADVICANTIDAEDCDLFFSFPFDGHETTFFYIIPNNSNSMLVQPSDTVKSPNLYKEYKISLNESITIYSDLMNFEWNQQGNINSFALQYNYYPSYCNRSGLDQNSGAYIFRPAESNIGGSSPYSTPHSSKIYQGKVVTQIYIEHDKMLTNLRFYNYDDSKTQTIEIETFVSSIDVSDSIGKEVVLLIKTNIENNKTFYTDSNGMEMQKRILNYRPTWNLTVHQPVAGNYYPVNSAIYIEDVFAGLRATVMTDRTQGGASIHPGDIELMIQRRIVCNDGKGLNEPLNETDMNDPSKGLSQWIYHNLIFTQQGKKSQQRAVQFFNDQPLLINFASLGSIAASANKKVDINIIEANNIQDTFELPDLVKVLFKPYGNNSYAVWFHNMDSETSVDIDTAYFDKSIRVGRSYNLTEFSLSANQPKSLAVAKRREAARHLGLKGEFKINNDYKSGIIHLRPLEIRTFELNIEE